MICQKLDQKQEAEVGQEDLSCPDVGKYLWSRRSFLQTLWFFFSLKLALQIQTNMKYLSIICRLAQNHVQFCGRFLIYATTSTLLASTDRRQVNSGGATGYVQGVFSFFEWECWWFHLQCATCTRFSHKWRQQAATVEKSSDTCHFSCTSQASFSSVGLKTLFFSSDAPRDPSCPLGYISTRRPETCSNRTEAY